MQIGAVDLFCGVGGLTYGIQKTDIKVVAGIDVDGTCEFPYQHNNHSKFINQNISDVSGEEIKSLLRGYKVKILVGCAPCQPFSNHRKDKQNRNNHKDWSLLYEFARIIEQSAPHIVSMENVPSIVHEKVFKDFILTLKKLNYYVTYSIINAADYGVPQRRRRLILLASKFNKKIKLIKPTHLKKKITVGETIKELPHITSGQICQTDRLHQAPKLSEKNILRIKASKPNGTWQDWPEDLMLDCHKKKTGKSYKAVYGRMSWDDVSPTITTQFYGYGTGRFGHPEQNRALSLREGALLQSFPSTYRFADKETPISFKRIARHIGNAVPPQLGEVIGISILKSLPNRFKK